MNNRDYKVIMLVFGFLFLCGSGLAAYRVGDTVTNWTLNDHLGRTVSLTDFAGSVVIINFWQDT